MRSPFKKSTKKTYSESELSLSATPLASPASSQTPPSSATSAITPPLSLAHQTTRQLRYSTESNGLVINHPEFYYRVVTAEDATSWDPKQGFRSRKDTIGRGDEKVFPEEAALNLNWGSRIPQNFIAVYVTKGAAESWAQMLHNKDQEGIPHSDIRIAKIDPSLMETRVYNATKLIEATKIAGVTPVGRNSARSQKIHLAIRHIPAQAVVGMKNFIPPDSSETTILEDGMQSIKLTPL